MKNQDAPSQTKMEFESFIGEEKTYETSVNCLSDGHKFVKLKDQRIAHP